MQHELGTKSALVLSGGGAFGAYEIGVIKALIEGSSPATGHVAIEPDIFVGTSVGSFNAAMLATNKGGPRECIANLEDIWRDRVVDKGTGQGNGVYRIRGNPANYFDPRLPNIPIEPFHRLFDDTKVLGKAAIPRLLHLLAPGSGLADRVEGLFDVSAFLDISPFCHLVESTLEPKLLRESGKVLRVLATNWSTGEPEEFDFRHMNDEETWAAIRASAAIPGLFPPVKIWDQTFIDGGVVQNTPIKPALEECAAEIHVVSLNAQLSQFPQGQLDNTLETFSRVYTAMLSANIEEDVETARWVNEGIDVMERAENGEDLGGAEMRRFAMVASAIYRKLRQEHEMPRRVTIHRYFPNKCLGDIIGMLNFHAEAIETMIEQGYADAQAHDCEVNRCVLPASARKPVLLTARA